MDERIDNLKKNIIAIGRLLWEKELVSGLNGNISLRLDNKTILLTAHGTCLGLLQEEDILQMNLNGEVIGEGSASSEKLLHTEIYKNFSETTTVIHTHTLYTNAYFIKNDLLIPQVFESKFYLGEVKAVPQLTPSVTDAAPVIEAFKKNNIVVLKNHGVVTMGKDLFDCFLLIQALEDAAKIETLSRIFDNPSKNEVKKSVRASRSVKKTIKKHKLFSQGQIDEIVKVVNSDPQMQELGEKTNMTMDLAVKMDETGKVYSFSFQKGRIKKVGHDEKAEFLINAPEKVWRSVFNQEIDPFVATTQKKMHLRGDFAKISKWYAPCSRVFELWQKVPIE